MRPASPHISADDTAALPRRGIVGIIATGVDDDLFRETLLELTFLTLEVDVSLEVDIGLEVGEGILEGLDAGVVKVLKVLEVLLDAGSRPRGCSLGGESSDKSKSKLASLMMSIR